MTRAMLDGMDDFWRMRAWLDISALREERRARILPFIVDWAKRGADALGRARLSRLQPDGGDARRRRRRLPPVRRRALADRRRSPPTPPSWPSPTNDPSAPFEHIAFTLPTT